MSDMDTQQDTMEAVLPNENAVDTSQAGTSGQEASPADTPASAPSADTPTESSASQIIQPLVMNLGGEQGAVVIAKVKQHVHDVVFHLNSKGIAYGCITNLSIAQPVEEPLPELVKDFVIPHPYRFEVTGNGADVIYDRTMQNPFGIVFYLNVKDVQFACFTEGRIHSSEPAAPAPTEEVPAGYASAAEDSAVPAVPAVDEMQYV